jgi:hypothetical protein
MAVGTLTPRRERARVSSVELIQTNSIRTGRMSCERCLQSWALCRELLALLCSTTAKQRWAPARRGGGLRVHARPPRYPRILVCTRQRSTGVGERVWTARMCKQIQGGAQPLHYQLSSCHGPFRNGEPGPSTRQRVPCCLSVSVHEECRSAFEVSLTACIRVGRAMVSALPDRTIGARDRGATATRRKLRRLSAKPLKPFSSPRYVFALL